MKLNQSIKTRKTSSLGVVLAASILIPSLAMPFVQGAATIYEGFTYPDADTKLTGNPGGTGLSGNWSAGGIFSEGTGKTYGSLETSGSSTSMPGGWDNANIAVTPGVPLTALLADDGEMWFSAIYTLDTSVSSDQRFYMALTEAPNSGNNGSLGTGVTGIGFGLASNEIFYANVWETNAWGNNLQQAPTGGTVENGQTGNSDGDYFVVGRVQWGADGAANDTVTLYLPGTDLVLGSAVASATGIVNQANFDNLALQNLRTGAVIDEIRFGATYADVSPVPEPSTTALLGLGGLALILRRRK